MSYKRGPYRSPAQQERQQRILSVTKSQLKSNGVSKLTMRGVAEASAVSLKTLYNVFGNRDVLLLRVATERYQQLASRSSVREARPGIHQLLAYAEEAIAQFTADPEFSAIVIGILLQLDKEVSPVDDLIALFRERTADALNDAVKNAELRADIDVEALATLLCAHQWGLVLLWERELMTLDQLGVQLRLSHCLTLSSLSRGQTKKWLQEESRELIEIS